MSLTNRGCCLTRLDRFADALADFDRVEPAQTKDHIFLGYRARCLHGIARYDEAISEYTHALEIDPSYRIALHGRGIALTRLRRFDDALTDLKRAASLPDADAASSQELARQIVAVYRQLAYLATQQHQPDMAIEYYDEVIRSSRWHDEPEYEDWAAEALMDKGKVLMAMGHAIEAQAVMIEFSNRYGEGRALRLVLRSWRDRARIVMRRAYSGIRHQD